MWSSGDSGREMSSMSFLQTVRSRKWARRLIGVLFGLVVLAGATLAAAATAHGLDFSEANWAVPAVALGAMVTLPVVGSRRNAPPQRHRAAVGNGSSRLELWRVISQYDPAEIAGLAVLCLLVPVVTLLGFAMVAFGGSSVTRLAGVAIALVCLAGDVFLVRALIRYIRRPVRSR